MSIPSSQLITRQSGSNLALAFFSLPPEKKQAMNTFYAFCRIIDDAADSDTLSIPEKRAQLGGWREEIRRAYLGCPETSLGLELAQIIRTYLIPPTPLEEILNGVEMDLEKTRYATFAELELYCYRVASAVGLVSIEIFTYAQLQTREYAVALGMAFQLTNILRDVKKDASYGRIYLPKEDWDAFGVTEEEILQGVWSGRMQNLLRFEAHRARHYFAKSLRLLHPLDRPNLLAAEIMREVYSAILDKVERRGYNVFAQSARLNKLEKGWFIGKALWRERRKPADLPKPKKIVVLGGGFAGIAAAVRAVQRGHDVTLLEAKSYLGGRAGSFDEARTGEHIDNGQHILMGCYHDTLRLLDHLGVADRLVAAEDLKVPYVSNRGASVLEAAALPAPWHLFAALMRFRELSWADRWAAVQLSTRLKWGQGPWTDETVVVWLERWGQTPNVIRAVWEPLCLAAMNEPVSRASATLFATVIRRSLLAGRADATIVLSRVGLTALFAEEAVRLIRMCGGVVRLNQTVKSLELAEGHCAAVQTVQGERLEADHVISALPWHALRALVPENSRLGKSCRELQDAPIVSLHFWLDKKIMDEPFVGFLDSPLHWVFDRTVIEEKTSGHGFRYALVVSAAGDLINRTNAEIEALAWGEFQRLWPQAREATILHRFIYKSRSATFAATPEAEPFRPEVATQWKNLWLAGDWTDTELPATIEGAVTSGFKAAEAVDAAG